MFCSLSKKRLQHRCLPTNIPKFLRTRIFKNIYERLFLYFEKWKNGKLKTRKSRKSRKSWRNYSKFSYFRVFDFALQPKSKTRIWNSWKKISGISEVSEFSTWPKFMHNLKHKKLLLWNLKCVCFNFTQHCNPI